MSAGHPLELDSLFGDYPLDGAFDEMREANGDLRPHYRALTETLARLPEEELQRRKQLPRASRSRFTDATRGPNAFFLTICFRGW